MGDCGAGAARSRRTFLTSRLWTLLIAVRRHRFAPDDRNEALAVAAEVGARTGVAFAALVGVLASYRTLNGIDAGTALLVVMAGMKLLETNSTRDLTVVVFLSYFALFAAFLYNQNMVLLPYMLVTAWLLTATLMRIHQTEAMPVREAAGTTAKMFLQALPLAVLLFYSSRGCRVSSGRCRRATKGAHRIERRNDARATCRN